MLDWQKIYIPFKKNINMKDCIKKGGIIFIFLLFLNLTSAQEFNYVISNSEDWKDVYSSMLYASLEGAGSDFLVNTKHGSILLNDLSKNLDIRVITSNNLPYVFNYPDLIRNQEFADVDEIIVDSANLELIEELPEIVSQSLFAKNI